jgi:hypothetical protein
MSFASTQWYSGFACSLSLQGKHWILGFSAIRALAPPINLLHRAAPACPIIPTADAPVVSADFTLAWTWTYRRGLMGEPHLAGALLKTKCISGSVMNMYGRASRPYRHFVQYKSWRTSQPSSG